MKRKIIFAVLAVVLLCGPAWGQYRPWQKHYRDNIAYRGAGNFNDPLYNIFGALDGVVSAVGTVDTGGTVYYVDDNAGDDDNDGLSWANPFKLISVALRASHVNIATSPNFANRNRIYVKGDDFDEDLTDLAQKTDIIGVGSDDGAKMPRLLGQHVIDTADTALEYMGCRFINMYFQAKTTDTYIFDIPTGHNGIEFIGCRFRAYDTGTAYGIRATIAHDLKIIGCTFDRAAIGNEGFTTAAIAIEAGDCYYLEIIGNKIDSAIGIVIDGSTIPTGGIIANNLITAATLTIDDNSNKYYIANNILISDTTVGSGSFNFDDTFAAGNILTGSDYSIAIPALDHLNHLMTDTIADEIKDNSFFADLTTAASDWGDFVASTDSLEAISDKITALEGQNFMMTATTGGAADTFISTDGGDGFGDHFFNTGWAMIITYDQGASGGAPEGDVRDILSYTSSSGIFTVAPVWSGSQSTTTGDMAIVVRHESLNPHQVAQMGGSGRIIYVDNGQPGTPDTGDIGDIWDLAYPSITAAIAGATLNNGDVILVAAGHTETLGSAQIDLDVAGVRIIGKGVGSTMPIINFSAADSSIDVTAADVYIENMRFRATTDDVLICFDLAATADGFHIKNCIFDVDPASLSDEFLETIEFKAGAVSNVTIEGCEFYADDTADATEAIISEVGVSDNTKIIGNTFIGSWVASAIFFSQAHTNMLVKDNVIQNFESGQHSFEATVGCTGLFVNNTMHGDDIGEILDPGSLMCTGNTASISINEAGITLPLSADTSGVGEAADGSNLERLEWLQIRSDDVLASLGRDTVADNVWFVDSVATIDGTGVSWATSELTLKAAIDNVVSNVDSIIFLASNHIETFTTSVAVDAPGVTIIGLGQGPTRPVLSFNDTGAVLTHSVANVRYENIVFQNITADSTVGILLGGTSDGAKFTNCEFLSATEYEFLSAVTLSSACDDVEFHGCKFNNLTAGTDHATAAITVIAGVVDGLVVDNCEFYGKWSSAAVISDKACTDVIVKDNIARNTEAGAFAIEFSAAALGSCVNNMVYTDSYGIGLDPGSMACFNNKHVYDVDGGTIDVPLIAGKSYTLSASQASITNTTDPLFAIAGGPIRITDFFGVVDTQCGTSTMLIQSVAAEAGTTFPYTDAVAVDGDVVGTTYTFTGAVVSVLTPLAGAQNRSDTDGLQWYAPIGTIDQLGSDGVAGLIDWYMTFTPLGSGVVVTDDS